jgi:hypothetical protein
MKKWRRDLKQPAKTPFEPFNLGILPARMGFKPIETGIQHIPSRQVEQNWIFLHRMEPEKWRT